MFRLPLLLLHAALNPFAIHGFLPPTLRQWHTRLGFSLDLHQ
jgi:hypothetical protein